MVKATNRYPEEIPEDPDALIQMSEQIALAAEYGEGVKRYFIDKILGYIRETAESIRRSWTKLGVTKDSPKIFKEPWRLTEGHMRDFMAICKTKYFKAKVRGKLLHMFLLPL